MNFCLTRLLLHCSNIDLNFSFMDLLLQKYKIYQVETINI